MKLATVLCCIAAMAPVASYAARPFTVTNSNSVARLFEIRAGVKDDCNANDVVWTGSLNSQETHTVSYGYDVGVTLVCARYSLGGGWFGWNKGSCPTDSSSCSLMVR